MLERAQYVAPASGGKGAVRAFAEKSFEERKQMGYSGRKLVEEKFDKRIAVAQTLGGLGIAEAVRN